MNESDAKKWPQQFQREAKVTKDFFRDVQKTSRRRRLQRLPRRTVATEAEKRSVQKTSPKSGFPDFSWCMLPKPEKCTK
jgi:hypothetical protein